MKRALITGVTGQDGAYLARLLLEKGYTVFGTHRPGTSTGTGRLRELKVEGDVVLSAIDLRNEESVREMVALARPDEVYNLAAESSVTAAQEKPLEAADINALGTLRLLETLRRERPGSRFFQASSSHLFGNAEEIPQTEETPFRPCNPYGTAKLFAHWATVNYRNTYGMFSCSAILFNHESPLRGESFVTRKITTGVARLKRGSEDPLRLGNLDVRRDWGYAGEYVRAMWLMLQQKRPEDYIVASGEAHTVREFVEAAFETAELGPIDWTGHGRKERGVEHRTGKVVVETVPEFFREAEVGVLLGDPRKAREHLEWTPRVRFRDLVAMMVEADLRRFSGDPAHPHPSASG